MVRWCMVMQQQDERGLRCAEAYVIVAGMEEAHKAGAR